MEYFHQIYCDGNLSEMAGVAVIAGVGNPHHRRQAAEGGADLLPLRTAYEKCLICGTLACCCQRCDDEACASTVATSVFFPPPLAPRAF